MSRVFATQENDNLLLQIKRICAFDLLNQIKKINHLADDVPYNWSVVRYFYA